MKEPAILMLHDAGHAEMRVNVACSLGAIQDEVWHPLMFLGSYLHQSAGCINLTEEDALKFIAAFRDGEPTTLGIPIDENAGHQILPEGAGGWVTDLRVGDYEYRGKSHRALLGKLELNEKGRRRVTEREAPFLSPMFSYGRVPFAPYKHTHTIYGVAQVTRPFYYGQAPVSVRASVAVHQESLEIEYAARLRRYPIEPLEDAILLPPGPEGDYADPVNFRWPLTPTDALRVSVMEFKHNREQYSHMHSRRIIWARLVRACKEQRVIHRYAHYEPLDRMLPPDLQAWAIANAAR